MNLIYAILSVLVVVSVSFAVPVQPANHGRGYRGELIRKSTFNGSGSRAGAGHNPEERGLNQGDLMRRAGGILAADLEDNQAAYVTPVVIGGQTFSLLFDTGSSELWVYSTFSDPLPHSPRKIYDPANSTTAVATEGTFNISYGDGTIAEGIVFLDTLDMGGLIIEGQAVGAGVIVRENVAEPQADGILGLSPSVNTILPSGVPTLLDNLMVSDLPEKVFTCALTRLTEPPGFFTFGFIDPLLTGDSCPDLIPVDASHGLWEFSSEFIILNGERIDRSVGNTAFADTGTTLILLDNAILPTIYEPLGGVLDPATAQWLIPTDTTLSQIPTLVLPAGDIEITLAPQDFVEHLVNDSFFSGSLQSRENLPLDIFGEFWLRNCYAIWDFGTPDEGLRFGAVQRPAAPLV
jgi:Eukaryotic aspartyl protease